MKFKDVHVSGRNLDEVWFKLMFELTENGRVYRIDEGSFKGAFRLEFDYVSGTIYKPIEYIDGVRQPIVPTVPAGCIAPLTDADAEKYFVNYLMDGKILDKEEYRYSTFIVGGNYEIPKLTKYYNEQAKVTFSDFPVVVPNQLEWCIEHFKTKGFGNNHCRIMVGYPESNLAYDVPYKNETERRTSPCLQYIGMKIIKDNNVNYLCFDVNFRSWDGYFGLPENLSGMALLMEYTANELGVEIGALSFASKGLHVYDTAISQLAMKSGNSRLEENFKRIVKEIECTS